MHATDIKSLITLVIHPDPRLKTKSEEIKAVDDEVRNNLERMAMAMDYFRGIGLAGVQIGYMKQAFVMNYDAIR